ncbi:hypothetical protein KCP78_09700 [Salmonella enterica subsp. enterica]|nr:hypothetical protein KCP78_09700 [Salmonella enterica subsp. enterica]
MLASLISAAHPHRHCAVLRWRSNLSLSLRAGDFRQTRHGMDGKLIKSPEVPPTEGTENDKVVTCAMSDPRATPVGKLLRRTFATNYRSQRINRRMLHLPVLACTRWRAFPPGASSVD